MIDTNACTYICVCSYTETHSTLLDDRLSGTRSGIIWPDHVHTRGIFHVYTVFFTHKCTYAHAKPNAIYLAHPGVRARVYLASSARYANEITVRAEENMGMCETTMCSREHRRSARAAREETSARTDASVCVAGNRESSPKSVWR